jgi:hypothetical protein
MAFALGDAVDDTAGLDASSDANLQQLHLIAVAIVNLRNYIDGQLDNISNADAPDVDWQGMTTAAQSIVQLKAQFQHYAALRAQQTKDLASLNLLEQAVLDIGAWAQGVLNALPTALAAIPNALIDALGKVASNAGGAALSAALPWAALVAGGIGLLLLSEKSRTVRRALR